MTAAGRAVEEERDMQGDITTDDGDSSTSPRNPTVLQAGILAVLLCV